MNIDRIVANSLAKSGIRRAAAGIWLVARWVTDRPE
jgi:hypothetical protein